MMPPLDYASPTTRPPPLPLWQRLTMIPLYYLGWTVGCAVWLAYLAVLLANASRAGSASRDRVREFGAGRHRRRGAGLRGATPAMAAMATRVARAAGDGLCGVRGRGHVPNAARHTLGILLPVRPRLARGRNWVVAGRFRGAHVEPAPVDQGSRMGSDGCKRRPGRASKAPNSEF
jgi:hypothetical protein